VEAYRWRLSGSFIAHLFKAATQQHHRALAPTLARLIPTDAVVFDVGAHAGQYTKLFAHIAPAGRVYAFEPGAYARSILRIVVWLHRLGNVTVLPMALGAASGIAPMSVPVKGRGSLGFGLAHLGAPQARWQTVAREFVPVTTIDAAVEALTLDRLDFIKADIEGWELRLLRGGEHALRRFRPRLLIELSEAHLARAGDSLADAFTHLSRLGYSGFRLESGGRLAEIESPADGDFWFLADNGRPLVGRPAFSAPQTGRTTRARPVDNAQTLNQSRRVPSSCINIINRLMKSRYSRSAPMIAFLPAISPSSPT
jgi:FkbM family methyltransferase